MSEGKHAPGPYMGLLGTRTLWRKVGDGGMNACHLATFAPSLDQAEMEELVDLLNKGTHFDDMLEALRTARQAMESAILSTGPGEGPRHEFDNNHPAMRQVRAAIAEAEPESFLPEEPPVE